MIVVPGVRIFLADAMQVRPRALRSPEKRMVVNKLPNLRVFAVALGFRTEWTNHVRVATHAAFTDVNVTSHEFQRRVWLHGGDGRNVLLDRVHRDDFPRAADE